MLFRSLPIGKVVIRIHEKDSLFETLARIAAARISGCRVIISIPPKLENRVTAFLGETWGQRIVGDSGILRQTDPLLTEMIPAIDRIRYADADRVPHSVYEKAAELGFYIARNPVMMEGRIELLHYFREQCISHNYHRYGNLGERAML